MKTNFITCHAILFIFLIPILSYSQEINSWGEINAGYANHGTTGSAAFNVRNGKLLFGTQYNKSHACTEDHNSGELSIHAAHTETHFTVESISLLSGIILPGKWSPSFSIGISLSRFTYMKTTDIDHNVTANRIWATIINEDYKTEKINSHSINTIGIPAEFKIHLSPKRFIGFDAGIKADLNLHSPVFSAEIGIRFGRIITKHSNNHN